MKNVLYLGQKVEIEYVISFVENEGVQFVEVYVVVFCVIEQVVWCGNDDVWFELVQVVDLWIDFYVFDEVFGMNVFVFEEFEKCFSLQGDFVCWIEYEVGGVWCVGVQFDEGQVKSGGFIGVCFSEVDDVDVCQGEWNDFGLDWCWVFEIGSFDVFQYLIF